MSYFKNANGSAEVLEENNYYPFGLKHEGYNPIQGNPAYKYQFRIWEVIINFRCTMLYFKA
ncbi:hypothetical protein [Chryseobacterium sp. Leaf405]|uniref:hypothetical protein n=1 Tax=Chryseobacterium sp. Leaf405 TaxID=1736367 RepID=UPI00103F4D8E|nr:hypothetical protein [Chryseobacterium sp. Leaf405]